MISKIKGQQFNEQLKVLTNKYELKNTPPKLSLIEVTNEQRMNVFAFLIFYKCGDCDTSVATLRIKKSKIEKLL